MCATCALSAAPVPTTDFFTRRAAYSPTFKPLVVAAKIQAARAWPSFSALIALSFIKASSTPASDGLYSAINVVSASKMKCSRDASGSFVGGRITPCATWVILLPVLSITPQPQATSEGSIPIIRVTCIKERYVNKPDLPRFVFNFLRVSRNQHNTAPFTPPSALPLPLSN